MGWDCEDRQSARLDRYDEALTQLVQAGRAYAVMKRRMNYRSNARPNCRLDGRLFMTVLD